MRHRPYVNAEPDEAASVLTAALVLTLFGVLSCIEAIGWLVTMTLFILAAVTGVRGLVLRSAKKD